MYYRNLKNCFLASINDRHFDASSMDCAESLLVMGKAFDESASIKEVIEYVRKNHQGINKENEVIDLFLSIVVSGSVFFDGGRIDDLCRYLTISELRGFVKKLLLSGLYEEAIYYARSSDVSEVIEYILQVCKDRHLYKVDLLFKKISGIPLSSNDVTSLFEAIVELRNAYLSCVDSSGWGHDTEGQFLDLVGMNPNESLSKYIDKYIFCYQKCSSVLGYREFFSQRRPYPVILQNHLWQLQNMSSLFSETRDGYIESLSESRGDIGDLLFIFKNRNNKAILFENFTVASFQKACKLYGIDNVTTVWRDVECISKLLPLNMARSQLEMKRHDRVINKNIPRLFSNVSDIGDESKVAVCISGQLRGAEDCLPYWLDEWAGNNTPVFLSTWDNVGFPSGSEAGRLARMIPDKYSRLLKGISDDEFKQFFPRTFELMIPKEKSIDLLTRLECNCFNISTVIGKELFRYSITNESNFEIFVSSQRGEVARVHLNQIKMFFQIYQVIQMMEDYEKTNGFEFDKIIWARPDFKVDELDLDGVNPFYAYTSAVSDEGRMLDYLMIIDRKDCSALKNCFLNLISNIPSPVFGYNHGPRLITDMFISMGVPGLQLPKSLLASSGLKSWRPSLFLFEEALAVDVDNLETPPSMFNEFLRFYEKTNC